MTENRFLTIEEVSAYLGIKIKTLYAKLAGIPHYKVGRLVRFRRQDIDVWMESQRRDVRSIDAKRLTRAHKKGSDIDAVVRRAIDEVHASDYTSSCGKSDRIKGLEKER